MKDYLPIFFRYLQQMKSLTENKLIVKKQKRGWHKIEYTVRLQKKCGTPITTITGTSIQKYINCTLKTKHNKENKIYNKPSV